MTHQPRSAAQRIAIILAVMFQIGATFLPQLGIGQDIGSQSDDTRTLITPIGWAFSIWGPLFLGSAVFALWQALPMTRRNALLDRIGWPAAFAFLGNGLWATYTQLADLTIVSSVIIAATLASLMVILRRLTNFHRPFTTQERWIAVLLFSALAAWLTAATIVNIAAMLQYHGIFDAEPKPWLAAVIVLVGGIVGAAATAGSKGNPYYAGTFLWALFGIFMAGGQMAAIIAGACVVAALIVAVVAIMKLRAPKCRRRWLG
ncbi:hypothetical protein [Pseudopontixanthobacter vadosimaris]|uniref:hypothetical protein n=1 Tax=Pseudopontixanthobacter vadosimaris TaxID=2726450 RepID=UPI001473C02A|nr:hypothetical protein [Pseudopontixanthobacter vadosimaris]